MISVIPSVYTQATPFPPAYGGSELAYAFSVFGLLTCGLLAAEWLWRMAWSVFEYPRPLKHPVTVTRVIISCLLVGILMRVTPDIILVMSWPELAANQRYFIAYVDKLMDGLSSVPMFLAWMTGLVGGAMVDFQLARLPLPIHLWPTMDQMKRPMRIGLMVLGISLALTYLR